MHWKHRRNAPTAERKKKETDAGTRWSFIAAATIAA